MDIVIALTVIAVGLVLVYSYSNGSHDVGGVIATAIASGAMTPRQAVMVAGVFEFLGPLCGGSAVAITVGKLVNVQAFVHTGHSALVILPITIAAIVGAVFWNVFTLYVGMPSSSSHGLVGGVLGAALMAAESPRAMNWGVEGFNLMHPHGVLGVVAALVLSPLLGFVVGALLQQTVMLLLRWATPRANHWLGRLQWVSVAALAFSHGANDSQKSMGLITMVLVATSSIHQFAVPLWVRLACGLTITVGALSGGWQITKTLGSGIFHLRTVHGFSAQFASAFVILGQAMIGGPVSATQIVSSAITGVGFASRKRAVKWSKVKGILVSWVVTIPAAAAVSAAVYLLLYPITRLL